MDLVQKPYRIAKLVQMLPTMLASLSLNEQDTRTEREILLLVRQFFVRMLTK